jgi:hypothetical protein
LDITLTEPVVLAGSPTQLKSSSVSTRLYARALVLSAGGQKVAIAARDLTPCRLGTSKGKAEGVSECRRVIKEGKAWNR